MPPVPQPREETSSRRARSACAERAADRTPARSGAPPWAALLLLASAWLIVQPALGSGVYKWVDDDGKVHYGDRPPAGAASDEVRLPEGSAGGIDSSGAASAEERRLRRQRLLESFEADRKQRAAEAQEKEDEIRARREHAEKCAAARRDLQRFRDSQYLFDETESGERRIYTAEERAAAEEALARSIARECD